MKRAPAAPILQFPRGFLWGTATAAHQVEGENTNNQWAAWERTNPGRFFNNQTAGDACGWWDGRAEGDIGRMRHLHNNSHRMSIEWSRIEPEPGRWDDAAIDRYRAILTAMGRAGIRPMVTLHHFTNPIWMEELGAWRNPDAPRRFGGFVHKAVAALSDLCSLWCTINEPSICAGQDHADYAHLASSPKAYRDYSDSLFNLLRAHAEAYHVIHLLQPDAKVGLAHRGVAFHPRRQGRALDRMSAHFVDRLVNLPVLEALRTGIFKMPLARGRPASELKGTLDWIGLNYYERFDIRFDWFAPRSFFLRYGRRPGAPDGPAKWGEVYPPGLFDMLVRYDQCFGLPIYITENGIRDADDTQRPAFLLHYLREAWRALQQRIPVMGYYHWSLIDNFEWGEAYDPRYRFGLYAVDLQTQARTLKMSGELYRAICKTGAITPDLVDRYAPELAKTLEPQPLL